jgi:hypothetical protein
MHTLICGRVRMRYRQRDPDQGLVGRPQRRGATGPAAVFGRPQPLRRCALCALSPRFVMASVCAYPSHTQRERERERQCTIRPLPPKKNTPAPLCTIVAPSHAPWHRLYLRPLPHGQGSLAPTLPRRAPAPPPYAPLSCERASGSVSWRGEGTATTTTCCCLARAMADCRNSWSAVGVFGSDRPSRFHTRASLWSARATIYSSRIRTTSWGVTAAAAATRWTWPGVRPSTLAASPAVSAAATWLTTAAGTAPLPPAALDPTAPWSRAASVSSVCVCAPVPGPRRTP